MQIPIFQVDAFAEGAFSGNPAAVCPLSEWLPDELMQQIAQENNLSETAFLVDAGTRNELRWFTPQAEVDLCGHATLACGYVVLEHLQPGLDEVEFEFEQIKHFGHQLLVGVNEAGACLFGKFVQSVRE